MATNWGGSSLYPSSYAVDRSSSTGKLRRGGPTRSPRPSEGGLDKKKKNAGGELKLRYSTGRGGGPDDVDEEDDDEEDEQEEEEGMTGSPSPPPMMKLSRRRRRATMQQLLEEEGYQRPEEGWRLGLEDERAQQQRRGARTPPRVTFGGRLEKKKKKTKKKEKNRKGCMQPYRRHLCPLLMFIHLDCLHRIDSTDQ